MQDGRDLTLAHGARWGVTGADHLVRVTVVRANGKPLATVCKKAVSDSAMKWVQSCTSNREALAQKQRVASYWLEVRLPVFTGPHACMRGSKYGLREIVRILCDDSLKVLGC